MRVKLLLITILIITFVFGAFDKRGTTGASWLKIDVGRASGMGSSFVALCDDATATFYNPSGLSLLTKRVVFFNHIDWIADVSHEYLSAVIPAGVIGNFGFSVIALTMGSMMETQIDSLYTYQREDEGTGLRFSASGMAVGMSFARYFTEKLSIGIGVKGIQERIWDMSASTFAFDVGFHFNTGFHNLRIGVAINNYGPEIVFTGGRLRRIERDEKTGKEIPISNVATPVPIPTTFRFGLAADLISTANSRLTLCTDLVHYNDINETFNIGFEYLLGNLFFIRGGYILNTDSEYRNQIHWTTGLSGGLGVKSKLINGMEFQIDYSYRHHHYLLGSHRVSVSFVF
ncbi:MAG: PorV/PorQ family protein [candidate division WOR-3 bacterium]|nr:PorV/PorQ family protein [candidate division WOR-3 bacterium]MCX7836893.1 PorV/PorQ family protein [candidate division WOR-3 bacterium]MDW8114276.1 PorV/PorQ family protein [candidate division WOR-3 bacterium]